LGSLLLQLECLRQEFDLFVGIIFTSKFEASFVGNFNSEFLHFVFDFLHNPRNEESKEKSSNHQRTYFVD